MVATSGAQLLPDDAVRNLREKLLPLATVLTPVCSLPGFFFSLSQNNKSTSALQYILSALSFHTYPSCLSHPF